MRKIRIHIAHLLWSLSSLLKGMGCFIAAPGTIVVDVLTIPGWFILDECIIHQRPLSSKKLKNGFEWLTWPMPDEWCRQMHELAQKTEKS